MPRNNGFLKANKTEAGDEVYTPFYAVRPLLKYIPKSMKIWCPFDLEWSAFVQTFREHNYKVVHSDIKLGKDFFEVEPKQYDIIVSNPPFSKKDEVLKRLQQLNKPFAMLFPITTLQGITRFPYLNKIQLLAFDKRINFHTWENWDSFRKGVAFPSAYFCRNLLPERLVIEELTVFERPLK